MEEDAPVSHPSYHFICYCTTLIIIPLFLLLFA